MLNTTQATKLPIQHEETASPTPQLYRHTFFSSQGAAARKALVPALVLPLIYNAVLLWACVSLFFGSLLNSNDVSKIGVVAVDLDHGSFGEGVLAGIRGSLEREGKYLKWIFSTGSDVWSKSMVLEEEAWAVLQVNANASFALQRALKRGDGSYDPLSAVTLYCASARNQVTTLSVAVPAVMGVVNPILAQLGAESTASFLNSIEGDQMALETALRCPQCLASPFAVEQIDLIPFTSPVAFGTLSTGLIFVRPPTPSPLSNYQKSTL
jgi:hypothetical protein